MCGVPHLHPLLRRAKRGSISVDFGACSDTQVAGKSKSGAQRLQQASKMATVTCTLKDTEETCSFQVPWCVSSVACVRTAAACTK
jgi:hypothetical protein